jgi:hypothetical protein
MSNTPFHTTLELLREIKEGLGVSLSAAARQLPGRGTSKVNPATVWRWARDGVRAPGGRRVRLEVALCGARHVTSQAAVDRFIDALNAPAGEGNGEADSKGAGQPGRDGRAREREVAAARAELERRGV